MRPLAALCAALVLSGCGPTYEQIVTSGERVCYVGGARGNLQGGVTLGPGGLDGTTASGGVVVIGECPENLRTFARSPTGSEACLGSDEWCSAAAARQPIPVTVDQLRALSRPVAPAPADRFADEPAVDAFGRPTRRVPVPLDDVGLDPDL